MVNGHSKLYQQSSTNNLMGNLPWNKAPSTTGSKVQSAFRNQSHDFTFDFRPKLKVAKHKSVDAVPRGRSTKNAMVLRPETT